MSRCNKCSQAEPFQGDSWCLACSGVEALGEELKAAWGSIGSRALAADSIRSCVRMVRGLRRLGIAGAGKIRVASPEVAGASRAASAAKTPLPPPPAPPVPLAGPRAPAGESPARPVKQEPEANSSEYSEGSESEEVEVDPEDRNRPLEGTNPAGLKAAPKSKPDNREEIPRRRPQEDRREREADHSRAPSHHERSRRSERDRRDRDREIEEQISSAGSPAPQGEWPRTQEEEEKAQSRIEAPTPLSSSGGPLSEVPSSTAGRFLGRVS